jgi:hypothetical protein
MNLHLAMHFAMKNAKCRVMGLYQPVTPGLKPTNGFCLGHHSGKACRPETSYCAVMIPGMVSE